MGRSYWQKRDLDVLNLRLKEWRKLPEDGDQRGEIVAEAVDKLGKIRGYPLDNVMREVGTALPAVYSYSFSAGSWAVVR